MGFFFGGNRATVNISMSGGVAITQNTPIASVGDSVNSGATIYTVTAGKTFYCTGISVGATTAAGIMRVQVAGTTKFIAPVPAGGNATLDARSDTALFTATAGQAITLSHTAGAGNGFCFITGYEV